MARGFDESEDEDNKDDNDDGTAAAAAGGSDEVDMPVKDENAREGEDMEQQVDTGVNKLEIDD
ncbi:hypothetical protein PG994_006469 [Apiospora phragmitis]|uniref:Uncharacterized protein n=1 Tax=Apiospora phragmitis TaxID=2905665 RepID=A0ABR1VF50_9PEZI